MKKILLLLIITICPLVCNITLGEEKLPTNNNHNNSSGLRDSEKEFIKKIQTKANTTENNSDEKNLETCQIALKKIDKLTVETTELKTFSTTDAGALKIKFLETQIDRYKIQAKQFCSEELLKQSLHM